jgi:hypothetical protein
MTNAKKVDFKKVTDKLTKIAQDELALGNKIEEQASAPSEAGPQEVVDAVAEIAADIESVISMIPAEPASDNPEDLGDATQNPMEPAADAPVDPEKEQMEAKLAKMEKQLDDQTKERYAQEIADIYGSEAKYAEILADSNDSKYWGAQLETIKNFADTMHLNRNKVAQTSSSYVKVAQLSGRKEKNLML